MKQRVPTAVPAAGPRRVGASSRVAQLCSCPKRQLSEEPVPWQAGPRTLPVPAQQAGCCPHLRFQLLHLGLLAGPLHGCHPVLVEVDDEELGGDASQEFLQCQGLQVSL